METARRVDRVDWAKAKTYFMAEHTRTLGDVAAHCKANPATIRARAALEKWLQQRNTMATVVQQKATDRLQDDQIDLAARSCKETILIARAIRKQVLALLNSPLSPTALNAVSAAHDRAVSQERLALGMSTSNADLTTKGMPVGGAFILPGVLTTEEWESAAREHQEALTRAH